MFCYQCEQTAKGQGCGEINLRAMELLDAGNTETYGHQHAGGGSEGHLGNREPNNESQIANNG